MTKFDVWSGDLHDPRPQNSGADNRIITGLSWNDLVASMTVRGLPAVTETTALTVSAIYACIALIAGTIAALPLEIYRRDIKTGELDQTFGDPLWWIFNEEFAPRWLASHAWEFLILRLLLRGNFYAIIRRTPLGGVKAIIPVDNDRVIVIVDPVNDRLVYAVEPEIINGKAVGVREIIDQDDMLHVAGLGFDGREGMSPLRYALRSTGAVALATQDYAAKFFSNSARPDYTLETEQKLEPARKDEIKAQVLEKYSGGERAHLPMILDGGLSAKALSLPLEEIQFLETRQFQIEEIARLFGVPPFMIGHNEKTTSWGSGMEAMGVGFIRFTLRPWLSKIQAEFNRKIHRTAAKQSAFDTTELEKADLKTLFDAFRVALGRAGEQPFMHLDEVRRALSLKKRTDLHANMAATPEPGAGNNEPQTA